MCACAAFTSRGYYLRVAFISFRVSDCAGTIRGRLLFEGGDYSRAGSIRRNMVCDLANCIPVAQGLYT